MASIRRFEAILAANLSSWASWSALGTGMDSYIHALATMPNGDVVAGGFFSTAGGVSASCIARWNGTTWSALGTGMDNEVKALMTLPNGDLVAGGYFITAGGVSAGNIASWNGTNWSALSTGLGGTFFGVQALTTLPSGDLVAAGRFLTAGGQPALNIARWNGTSWAAFGNGVGSITTGGYVNSLATLPNGSLVAGGFFTLAGGASVGNLAQLVSTCPATTASFGAGCTGSGGLNVLTASTLPWAGSTFRSISMGMPSNALVLSVLGLSTVSIPLSTILPSPTGCTLLVSPDLLSLYLPTAGSVQTQVLIPNTVALAGQLFHEQSVSAELSGTGTITALTSSNALTLTIGSF